ncbi:hypothetical protein K504DRAFT_203953 [Pleomassaria siparia CBS 279.74]|uniref:Zn(2)-C6 fungal-type domain-containing protein n=1 Tax=Pleomassaria siparia CBS 279.74 TaxID=1314801 RepID=A0A6G1KHW4_9PLEO|nr:hypothetical protein K504DRAFT_203953 [Pleomassaria siparia CBS 279.74]
MPTQGQNKRKPGPSNNDDAPKRSRVSRACDQCRIAREKCDGVQPVCFTCAASKRECTYTTNPKKRGIQPGYIRSLELALTYLFQNTDSEALLNKKLAQEGSSSVLLGRDTKDSNKLHKSWRKSRFCKDIDRLLSGEEISVLGESRTLDSDDEDTDADSTAPVPQYQLPGVQPRDDHSLYNPASIVVPHSETNKSYRLPSNMPPQGKVPISATLTVLHPNCWQLFDLYFAYTHCWFPISEKHDVLKLTYSYPENGLLLSTSKLPNSGDHAELWSILALASIQESQRVESDSQHESSADESIAQYTPAQLYETARALIPLELGSFELGHVKALLILALFNISQLAPEAAWLVIGHASRIILILQQRNQSSQALRFQHVFAGCFLLDAFVSTQLQRRPHLQLRDVEDVGGISEDGIEEWQPWSGCLQIEARNNSRSPVLSLSTFNNLVQITGILGPTTSSNHLVPSMPEIVGRIELWKSSLPQNFDYIRGRVATPPTPPALLLQIVYHCSSLALFSTQSWLHGILNLLEQSRNILGLSALPPILHCLLETVQRNKAFDALDRGLQVRFRRFRHEFTQAWNWGSTSYSDVRDLTSSQSRRSFGSADSAQKLHSSTFIPTRNVASDLSHVRTGSTLFDDLLPDINSTSSSNPSNLTAHEMGFPLAMSSFDVPQFEQLNLPLLRHRNSNASRDIENFFDELASLDGAERVENQPQFMENLGYAPDANMADLLSAEFGHFNSLPVYMPPGANEAPHLDPNAFYDGP